MSARAFVGLLLCSVLSLGPGSARAEGPRVILVRAGAGDPVSAHMVDELLTLGITVEIVPAGDPDLAKLGRARSARAVLRVTPSRRQVEVWVEGTSGATRIDETPDEQGDAAALALRAVETLRGRLLTAPSPVRDEPVRDEPAPDNPIPDNPPEPPRAPPISSGISSGPRPTPVATPTSPPQTTATPPLRPDALSLRIEPALLVQPLSGGISAAGTALLGARYRAAPRVGVDLWVLVPVLPASLASTDGRVQLATAAALAGGSLDLLPRPGRFELMMGAGIGAGMLSHFGQPSSARVEAHDGTVPYALPYARVGFGWRALPGLNLSADVLGAVATPRPVLRLPGRENDAYFGQPLLAFGLGISVALR